MLVTEEEAKEPTVVFDVLIYCKGVEGNCLYLNNHRIVGPKPWGGGTTIKEWSIPRGEILKALGIADKP